MGLCGCIIPYTFPPEKNAISDRSAAATLTPAVNAMKSAHLEFTTTAATTATAWEITKPSPQKMQIQINSNKKQNLKTKKYIYPRNLKCK